MFRAAELAAIITLRQQMASLLMYREVLAAKPGQCYQDLLQALQEATLAAEENSTLHRLRCLSAYSSWFEALAEVGQNWQDYLVSQILKADNPFSRQVQRQGLEQLPPALLAAARQDLQILQTLAHCGGEQLSEWVEAVAQQRILVWQQESSMASPQWLQQNSDWGETLPDLAAYYRRQGTGLFAERALRWQSGNLVGIGHPDPVELSELVGYERQQQLLVQNTEHLLAGYRALHVLLYGSRGSGKSSLVKGLLNAYSHRGLRLIEVAKSSLYDLPQVVDRLRDLPQKFIVFVDDLSFEEDDDAYKALKVILEGNLTARPQNVVVYATSNRRHLIREFFGDRPRPQDSDEVQAWDTVQEKLSFSDRFGLTLTFEPADQETYLGMVRHLAAQAQIDLTPAELEYRALQWATRHNGRSGRTARQFVDFLQAELATKKEAKM